MRAVELSVIVLLAATRLARTQNMITGCRDNEQIISQNPSLTPFELISASQTVRAPNAQFGTHFGWNSGTIQTWCTNRADSSPFLSFTFTEPLVITSFVASGTTDVVFNSLQLYVVTNFTISYWDPDVFDGIRNGSFVDYKTPENTTKYFSQFRGIHFFRLDPPIVTSGIMFRPVEAFDSQGGDLVCQGVGLFGCTATDAEIVTEPPVTTQPTTASLPEVTAQQIIVRDYQVLGILLPIALITILVVTVIVVVGVVICLRWGRESPKYDIPMDSVRPLMSNPGSPGVTRTVDNTELYTAPSETDGYIIMSTTSRDSDPQFSEERRRSTIMKLENPLYGSPTSMSEKSGIPIEEDPPADDIELIYSDHQSLHGSIELIYNDDPDQSADSPQGSIELIYSDHQSLHGSIEAIYSEPNNEPADGDGIELIYNDDPEPIYSEPLPDKGRRDSMAENPYYGREDVAGDLQQSFAYNLDSNTSYGKVDKVDAVENIYEEPTT